MSIMLLFKQKPIITITISIAIPDVEFFSFQCEVFKTYMNNGESKMIGGKFKLISIYGLFSRKGHELEF